MNRVRRHLVAIAALWLCAQLVLAASPFAAWCCEAAAMPAAPQTSGPSISAADPHAGHGGQADDEDECCKGLGPGQTCPLHKHRKPTSRKSAAHDSTSQSSAHHDDQAASRPASTKACALRATCNPSNAAPVPVMFEAGVVPTTFALLHAPTVDIVPDVTMVALLRSDRPDSPPPRG